MRNLPLLPSLLLALAGCTYMPWYEEPPPDQGCAERQVFYPDADGDGAGDDAVLYLGCVAPEGYVSAGGDCDDTDPATTTCPDTGDTSDTGT
jgi:hypothetical protein